MKGPNSMNKSFRILYYLNVVFIVFTLLTPIIQLFTGSSSSDELLDKYDGFLILLSITFCVSFFALNVYGALKSKTYRVWYIMIAILFFMWIIWGTYQIVYGYVHNIPM